MSPLVLSPLEPKDCPLLADDAGAADLLDAANRCARILSDLQDGPGRAALATDPGKKLLARYAAQRGRLTRPTYRVGFLGLSQTGKSTTYNNILGEDIAVEGGGNATTSIASRTRWAPEHKCVLRYMTVEQYKDRLRKLCLEVGIGDSSVSDADLLRQLGELRPGAGDDGSRQILPDDVPYLRAFINAYRQHRDKVTDNPLPVEVPYHDRGRFINHSYTGAGGTDSSGLLLQDVLLYTPNERLPKNLELCDLPGVGVDKSVDTIVTRDFVRTELDGALVFINVSAGLNSPALKSLVRMLAADCGGDLTGLAWFVANRSDGMGRANFTPAPGQLDIFTALASYPRECRIPESNIWFVSNKIAGMARDQGGAWSAKTAGSLMGLGGDPFPATLPAALRGSWEHLLADGGISNLRRLVVEEVGRSVAGRLRADAAKNLASLESDIAHLKKSFEQSASPSARRAADACWKTVLLLRDGLARGGRGFAVLADVRKDLCDELMKQFPADPEYVATVRAMGPARVAQQFAIDAVTLDERLGELLGTRAVDAVYNEVGERLAAVGDFRVGGYASVRDAWDEYRRADRDNPTRWAVPPAAFAAEPAALFQGSGSLDGPAYLGLMSEKVAVAVAHTVHGLRTQLRVRLSEVEGLLLPILLPGSAAAN